MAAMAVDMCMPCNFEDWLAKRLKDINIDDEIFGSYILGIVDTEESTEEDKMDALMGILTEITEEPVEETCCEILSRWQKSNSQLQQETEAIRKEEPSTDAKISSIMERHAAAQTKKEQTPDTRGDRDKQRLLARYAEVVDGDSSDEIDGKDDGPTRSEELLMMKNTNKESVDRAVKEEREKLKADYERRREQERQQREKDRLRALERKEKEKKRTQKGEKRR